MTFRRSFLILKKIPGLNGMLQISLPTFRFLERGKRKLFLLAWKCFGLLKAGIGLSEYAY
jgi:hypothetical protein